jgi:hypothetical protein
MRKMENSFIADKAATKHISEKHLHRDYPINNVKLELENDHEIQPTRVDLVVLAWDLEGYSSQSVRFDPL